MGFPPVFCVLVVRLPLFYVNQGLGLEDLDLYPLYGMRNQYKSYVPFVKLTHCLANYITSQNGITLVINDACDKISIQLQ